VPVARESTLIGQANAGILRRLIANLPAQRNKRGLSIKSVQYEKIKKRLAAISEAYIFTLNQ